MRSSNFRLSFFLDFTRQRREWLAQDEIPALELPSAVDQAVESIRSNDPGDPLPSTSRELWSALLSELRPLLLRAVLISLGSSIFAGLATLAAMRILRQEGGGVGMLSGAVAFFVFSCGSQFMMFLGGRLRNWVSLTGQATLVGWTSIKMIRLSALAAARQSSGNLKILVTSDVQNIAAFLESVVRNLIPSVMAFIVVTPFLVHLSGTAGLVGVGAMAVLLPISFGLNTISWRLQSKGQVEVDRLATLVGEWVRNIRLIRYLSWEDALAHDVSERLRRYISLSTAQHFLACVIFGFSVSWWMVAVTVVVVASRHVGGGTGLVGFFGSLWLLTFLAGYFTQLPNLIRLYSMAAPSAARVARFLSEQEAAASLHPGEPIADGSRPVRVRFDEVSFRYPDGKEAIRGLNAVIDLGRKVAVIGEVGSGKTTFLKLLCGEYPPTSGRISVEFDDGSTLDLWTAHAHSALRERLAYVPQEPFVSSDLLSENISLGGSDEGTLESAYWAELEDDLASFPAGIHQEIGESGVNLSGGQRQRLNLARARHSGREYLVLDDTLSAVDVATELRLVDRLMGHAGGFVLVTHRTGELDRVEEVMVLSDGRVAELGAPRELRRDPGSRYSKVLRAYEESSHV